MGRPNARTRRWIGRLWAAALCVAAAPVRAAEDAQAQTIEVGLLPTLSARRILKTYQPLREYLERALGRPVLLVTAPDYRTHVERTRTGLYRYAVTAPHFARLAQRRSGYRVLVRVRSALAALLVVRAADGVRRVEALRGQTVATPDGLAIVSMLGRAVLREHGLVPGRTVSLRDYRAFNSAVLAVSAGEVAAAVTAETALNQMPPAVRGAVRRIASSPVVPHVMLIAHGAVPERERERVKALLLSFGDDPAGKRFFERTGFGGYEPVAEQGLRALDPFVDDVEAALATP